MKDFVHRWVSLVAVLSLLVACDTGGGVVAGSKLPLPPSDPFAGSKLPLPPSDPRGYAEVGLVIHDSQVNAPARTLPEGLRADLESSDQVG